MCNRRSLALLALALCGCGNAVSTMDAAQSPDAGTAPDLAPVCLPVEPAPPALDPNCPVVKPAMADALDDALAHEGLDRCSLTLPTAGYAGVMKDPYKLPWYDQAHDFVVNAPSWARTLTARLDSAAASATPVANLLVTLGDRLGPSIAACAPAFAIDPSRPLAAALSALIVHTGGKADEAALDAAVAPVPMDLQRALAPIVFAIETANDDWTSLTQSLSPDDLTVLAGTSGLVLVGAGGMPPDLSNSEVKTLLSKTFDESALVTGAAKLAHAVESAKLAPYAGTMGFHVDIKTPIGRVVIADGRDDTYEDDGSDAIALLVDTGGNDVYRKPIGAVGGTQAVGTQQSAIHVAVAIDLAGNDQYGYTETPDPGDIAQDKAMAGIARLPSDSFGRYVRRAPDDLGPVSLSDEVRQGGARLGYGLLFDYGGGNDHYRALRMSQGFGCAGVGVLF